MSDLFKDRFGDYAENAGESQTTLGKRVSEIKTRKFANALDAAIRKLDLDTEKDIQTFNPNVSLIPIEYENDYSGTVTGKHFIMPTLHGFNRILFEVYIGIDYKSLTQYYYLEQLDSAEQLADEDNAATMYFVDDPISDGNQIVILDFNPLTNDVFINVGILLGDQLRISKKPVLFCVMKRIYDDYNSDGLHLISSAYDLKCIPDMPKEETNERWYNAELLQNPIIIIDPETAQPVRREVYFDEKTGKRKARIKLKHKSYFAVQIQSIDSNDTVAPLSELKIASYYRNGEYGFPKDVFEAISHYEKDGSADALYEIATIFRADETLRDEDTYLEYLIKAADMGSEGARVELALQYCLSEELSNRYKGRGLLENVIDQNSAIGNFVLGYLIESGILTDGAENAFDYYVEAARSSYKPALARLCCKQEMLDHKEELLHYYLETLEYGLTIAKYCMGCIYFFGFGISPNKPQGIEFLVEAAHLGNEMAVDALFKISDYDPEFKDKQQALIWLKAVEKFDSSVDNELANRLLDGIGCEINEDNDLQAFELFKKAAASGNKTAIHNLGWMYKEGRGCEVDYEIARKLFEEAEKPNSFYHLGDMNEKGLGCATDLDRAIEYYKKGAENGSKKARNRLEELGKDDSIQ